MPPTLLILVHTLEIAEAISAHESSFGGFAVQWSLDFPRKETVEPREIIRQIADLNPMLIVIELDTPAPWLPLVHSDPATRRIPIVAIAPNAQAEALAAQAEANLTLNPAAFIAALPGVLTDNVRVAPSSEALETQCAEPLPPLVLQGLHEFNAGEYYECHETLEHAWMAESGPTRDLYRAILQIGVAYYQIQRGNYNGALKMFLRSVQWFAPLPDRCQGIDVAQLKADADAVRAHLEALGAERIGEFDRSLLKPVQFIGGVY